MAAALWYDCQRSREELETVNSDDPDVHNPKGLACILVTGRSRPADRVILAPRLSALGATLISVN